ncbi:MAG: hypothetical protein WA879_16105 [Candidatus Acidiferrales bacterium]
MRNAGLLPAATLLHAFQYQESAQMFTDFCSEIRSAPLLISICAPAADQPELNEARKYVAAHPS